ncbi:hypothetical protein [Motilibacter deserti]|uniref:Uncharacterized protein n=1 Tax=Motilibacter deserti TaxID=2714956 RepID=A0ABX0H2X4_9ACTN|nr:hypothetical protein [Motilibacter deserti]NHC16067.1 hypothetical protein [Motilibacter deserti]
MTIPGGAGSETGQDKDAVIGADKTGTGLPATTGPMGDEGQAPGSVEGGGPVTDAVHDSAPDGAGSAEDPAG